MTDDAINRAIDVLVQRCDINAEAARSLLTRLSTYYQQPVIAVARRLITPSSAPTTVDPSAAGRQQPAPAVDGFFRNDNVHVQIATLIRDLHAREAAEVATVLAELTATATHYVPGAQYAGITTIDRRGRINTPASTGEYPRLLDVIQNRHQQGPCLQATREHHTVRVDDLTSDIRWPHYRRDALAQTPIRSVLSVAMSANGHTMGALNFYAERPHAFDAESDDLGFVYATYAALAWDAVCRNDQFRRALASRDIIGQAKGMLMACHQINATEAFERLRLLSQQSNTPVREIARAFVELDQGR
ncbi:MAG TPA: GAF and ANTAR domain-containing protein [Mycobacterium sp.]|nr:GAF and ANTAR domain-containing protein [Mycobacterium sp.]